MQKQPHESRFLVVLLVAALVLVSLVLWPFLKPLALAAVFAVVLQGVYKRIVRMLGGWESVSALTTVVLSILFILLPLGAVGVLVGGEARALYVSLETEQSQSAISSAILQAASEADRVVPGTFAYTTNAIADFDTYIKEALKWVAGHAGDIFSGVSRFLLSAFIFLIALYYFLRDGGRVRKALMAISPLPDGEDALVLDRLKHAVNSIIKGSLVVALVQGALTTIGFSLFGVPGAVLWGTVAAVAALIPGIGTSLVIVPGVLYLFAVGMIPQAAGLLVWGTLAVGLIDNMLGPKLVGKGMLLHPLLVLLSVLGGVALFGMVGIFLGPLSVSFLFALLSIYIDPARAA